MNLQDYPINGPQVGSQDRGGASFGGPASGRLRRPWPGHAADPIGGVKRRPDSLIGRRVTIDSLGPVMARFRDEHGWQPGYEWNPYLAEYVPPERAQEQPDEATLARLRAAKEAGRRVNSTLTPRGGRR